MQAEALEIVECIAKGVDFQFAAVARAGIDLADRQRTAELGAGSTVDARHAMSKWPPRTRCCWSPKARIGDLQVPGGSETILIAEDLKVTNQKIDKYDDDLNIFVLEMESDLGNLEYCREMIVECGLTPDDMFVPKPDGSKAIQRKPLPKCIY